MLETYCIPTQLLLATHSVLWLRAGNNKSLFNDDPKLQCSVLHFLRNPVFFRLSCTFLHCVYMGCPALSWTVRDFSTFLHCRGFSFIFPGLSWLFLYCRALSCIVLHWPAFFVLSCTFLYFSELSWAALHYLGLSCIGMVCHALFCTVLSCSCTVMGCPALSCTVMGWPHCHWLSCSLWAVIYCRGLSCIVIVCPCSSCTVISCHKLFLHSHGLSCKFPALSRVGLTVTGCPFVVIRCPALLWAVLRCSQRMPCSFLHCHRVFLHWHGWPDVHGLSSTVIVCIALSWALLHCHGSPALHRAAFYCYWLSWTVLRCYKTALNWKGMHCSFLLCLLLRVLPQHQRMYRKYLLLL